LTKVSIGHLYNESKKVLLLFYELLDGKAVRRNM